MEWNSAEIEEKWKKIWIDSELYKIHTDPDKPKYYVLDMFPYPSGAGLHVGHPLGYIASDIFSRYKRLNGFNVLHPMGYDAFGLPAEQFAVQTGVHPAISTQANINSFRKQLNNLGFSFDWSREVRTCDPSYYKWTQWIFLKMYNAWYDKSEEKSKDISILIDHFENHGTEGINCSCNSPLQFSASDWKNYSAKEQYDVLMNYRLMYRKISTVNWCEALGTVLANDEVKDGVSERGGFPVIKKPMMQWSMRTTAFAQRLLDGLDHVDWSDSLKIMQRNWIGRSEGARVFFRLKGRVDNLEIFTTRPDTIFGATFMVLAPEHPLVNELTIQAQQKPMFDYACETAKASEQERLNAQKMMTGVFTGSYAIHPFTGKDIPIWVSNYVLIEYGTGAIMAVPAGDERDRRFAETFNLEIREIIQRNEDDDDIESKNGILINSDFLNGLPVNDAIIKVIETIEKQGFGKRLINYRLRDANYSRQRYWGEPFPIAYDEDGVGHEISPLPLELPDIKDFKPTGDGSSPIARATEWVNATPGLKRETDTMPGFAGSSWYFLRYMDPNNDTLPFSKNAIDYWMDVDLYIGGAEHAVGHLLYSRTWHKFLYDFGLVPTEEPFKRLINQGMIQGVSEKIYLLKESTDKLYFKNNSGQYEVKLLPQPVQVFVSHELIQDYPAKSTSEDKEMEGFSEMSIHIDIVKDYGASTGGYLDKVAMEEFAVWRPEFASAVFVTYGGYYQNGTFHPVTDADAIRFNTKSEVEKMSKSKYNVINPDTVISEHGTDVFRMYEMFLGPLEQAKPWDTKGIEGVSKFLRRFWNLFFDDNGNFALSEDTAPTESLKVLHKTIKKMDEDINKFSFNTCVSACMIAVNEFKKQNVNHRVILEPMLVLLSPFAPFITEELWHLAGHKESVHKAQWPAFNEKYTVDDVVAYPICINGKKRDLCHFAIDADDDTIIKESLERPDVIKWMEGKQAKKVIVVKGKMVNIVV
ncbi:MAG TPA: class I tRNA ligase family protein [Saprospiraceae bacterium]|jgi:leucyl-tRNA synthetase|nr:MAG: class I tRNA ligase family protein [Saprospiraceae bacterium]HRN35157.1 class I tRNA ligase family protein [Saprospiraceae bacterium]HRP85432.1 class I tRNA ligase family protein [Saprospiraceae bacterium]